MKIGICSRSVAKNFSAINKLKKKFSIIKKNNTGKTLTGLKLKLFCKDCDAIIVGLEKLDQNFIDGCPKLKVIGKYGVGLNNLDIDYIGKKKIKLLLQPGINKRAVSELIIAMMINCYRNIITNVNDVKLGLWPSPTGELLSGKKIGIIGCGNIGKDIIKILKPFNCELLVNDINPNIKYFKSKKIKNTRLDAIFSKVDIATIHVPYNKKNHNFISNKMFKKIKKKNFILINTSRGNLVNENHLHNFLLKNPKSKAFFDVFSVEPPKNKNLLKLKNFFLTSHIGGSAKEIIKLAGLDCANKINKNI